jgi:hypothetical protein
MIPLIERVNAAQTAFDKYMFEPMAYGSADCAHLAATVLVALGHEDPLKGFRKYTTELGAKRSLLTAGYETVEEVLEKKVGLERIAPASVLPGDIVSLPGELDGKEWSALGVVMDADRVMAFADMGHGPRGELGSLNAATAAWRSI